MPTSCADADASDSNSRTGKASSTSVIFTASRGSDHARLQ
jgi:hypothetical protein